jgi:hypothetical protein
VCIHCLYHLPPPPPPLPTTPCFQAERVLTSSPICWRENIRDNKKDISFLLVWDKDSSTERFLALLPCTCELQPTLIHFFPTSSLLPGSLPIVASASLGLLYSLLYSEHIKHFWVLGFLSFHYFSHVCFPLRVWPMSNNITAFVWGL